MLRKFNSYEYRRGGGEVSSNLDTFHSQSNKEGGMVF